LMSSYPCPLTLHVALPILFSTKKGDPADYVAIKLKSGKRITITNSCAANVLGLVKPEHFSYGNANAARKAMQPIADYLGVTVEEDRKSTRLNSSHVSISYD